MKKLILILGLCCVFVISGFCFTGCDNDVEVATLKEQIQAEFSTDISHSYPDNVTSSDNEEYEEIFSIYENTYSYAYDYIISSVNAMNASGDFQNHFNEIGEDFEEYKKDKMSFEYELEKFSSFIFDEDLNSLFAQSLLSTFKKSYAELIEETLDLALSFNEYKNNAFALGDCLEVVSDTSKRNHSVIEDLNIQIIDQYFDFMVLSTSTSRIEDDENIDENAKNDMKIVKTNFAYFLSEIGDFSSKNFLSMEECSQILSLEEKYIETSLEIDRLCEEINWFDFMVFNSGKVEIYSLQNQIKIETVFDFFTNTLDNFSKTIFAKR